MACIYEVLQDGSPVWTDTTDEYVGMTHFPAEFRQRPTVGVVELVIDGEVIARQEPLNIDAYMEGVRRDIEGTLEISVDDAAAEVG
jgi:hypothetical protein